MTSLRSVQPTLGKVFAWTVLFCIVIWLFLSSFTLPEWKAVGLDPSWAYAIGYASLNHLVFGRDCIFTCGPYGYLVTNEQVHASYLMAVIWFRLFVHTLFCAAFLIKVLELKVFAQKIFGVLSLAVIYLLGIAVFEYELVYAYLIILSFDTTLKRSSSATAGFVLGIFAGFSLLTKFTAGFLMVGALIILFSTNFRRPFRWEGLFVWLSSLICVFSGTLLGLLLFYTDTFSVDLCRVIVCALIALLCGGIANALKNKRTKKHPYNCGIFASHAFQGSSRLFSLDDKVLLVTFGVFFILLSGLVIATQASLVSYLKDSLSFSSAFSISISLGGPRSELLLGILSIAIILLLGALLTKDRRLGWALVLTFVTFITFKHGFVRHDLHSANFFRIMPFIAWLCMDKLRSVSSRSISYICCFLFLLSASFFGIQHGPQLAPYLAMKTPSETLTRTRLLFNWPALKDAFSQSVNQDLDSVRLPRYIAAYTEGKPMDIVPWEFSIVAANHFNWKPHYTLQSFSALTAELDNRNAQSFLTLSRELIFYHFDAIDGRHQFFDEPATMFYILQNYQVSDIISSPMQLGAITNLIILQKKPGHVANKISQLATIQIQWGDVCSIPQMGRSILRAAIRLELTPLGKLYQVLFRVSPVFIDFDTAKGTRLSYRINPANSGNGVIVSHIPVSGMEAFNMFQGRLPAQMKSFRLRTSQPWLFASPINIVFYSSPYEDVKGSPTSINGKADEVTK